MSGHYFKHNITNHVAALKQGGIRKQKVYKKHPWTIKRLAWVLSIILYLSPLHAVHAQVESTITYTAPFSKKMTVLEYVPSSFNPKKKSALIIALHGMAQTPQSAYKHWKKVAESQQAILVCPKGSDFQKGYSRTPIDDRKRFVELVSVMKQKYRIDEEKIIIGGFSRGGNFAIESGILYPETFKHVIAVFGFFNNGIEKNIPIGPLSRFQESKFYLVTGKGDMTQTSLKRGKKQLDKYFIKNHLHTYKNLNHTYPTDFQKLIDQAIDWFET